MGQISIFSRICRNFLAQSRALCAVVFVLLVVCCTQLEASAYLPIYKADFWVGRLDNPDKPMLTEEQIKELNNKILGQNDEMANIIELQDTVSKQGLTEWLLEDPIPQDKEMFNRKGKIIKHSFYEKLADNMNVEDVKETNHLIFGAVAKMADIRAFPTDEHALKSPSAKSFDAFQYSTIHPPQPVALLHKSKDEKWGFFQTPFVRGWIKLDKIAFADNREELNDSCQIATARCSLIVIGSRIKVYKMGKEKNDIETVPMGTAFAFGGEEKNRWIVKFPEKDENGRLKWTDAFIDKKADVRIGPLAYTKQNAIRQAFKILGEEYGWGGRNGLRDCSSFIKDVFATFGINLPRHSSHQAAAGRILIDIGQSVSNEELKIALDSAVPGITLLGLNGHIMLYLGNVNGNYYTLHQFFGYHDKDGFRTVNKAVVTNLDLGKGSKMGAIMERIKSVNLLILDGVNL